MDSWMGGWVAVLVREAPGSACVFRSRCGLGEEQDVPASGAPSLDGLQLLREARIFFF